MDNITPTSFVLEVSEYGKPVRKYNDTNLSRFRATATSMINEHLNASSTINSGHVPELKNINFHIYTE